MARKRPCRECGKCFSRTLVRASGSAAAVAMRVSARATGPRYPSYVLADPVVIGSAG
jgi:hypothetical protein